MLPKRLNAIREAVDWMRNRQPNLFRLFPAMKNSDCLTEASNVLGYPTPESFTEHYHQAIESLVVQLELLGYQMPGSEDLEARIDWSNPDEQSHSDRPIPSREIINLWYDGHILHEALYRFQRHDYSGVRQLWDRFPDRHLEVEIAFSLSATSLESGDSSDPRSGDNHPNVRVSPSGLDETKNFIEEAVNRAMPAIAVAFSLFLVLTIALRPPAAGRAFQAISTSLEESLFSSQGIFNFSNEALKEASPPGSKSAVAEPIVSAAEEPRPLPRPKIARPDRPKFSLTSVPSAPLNLDLGRAAITWQERPSISGPDQLEATDRSNYFGNRPEVRIAALERSLPPGIGERPGMPTGPSFSLPTPNQEEPAQDNLKGYRPAGRIGFSSLQTSRGLSGELVRLTRIERYLSNLQSPLSWVLDGAKISLTQDRAQVNFSDGVAFVITFSLGRLDEIRIFLKSEINLKLRTEAEALRGIRLLNEALTN